jgi:calcineurin-like phosphoesterase family protein
MSDVFYVSDLHIGHSYMAQLRDYESVQDHDEDLALAWVKQVRSRDIVWVLGDVAMNPAAGMAWIRKMPGTKHLVAGNHDRCHPGHRDGYKYLRQYLDGFESVQPFARHRIAGTNIALSHYPYAADHTEQPREMQWRLRELGMPLLHGHTHSPVVRTSELEMHVGWDAHGSLVHRDLVAKEFDLGRREQ